MPQEELKRGAHFAKESAPQTPSSEASSSRDDTDDMGSSDYSTVGRSAGLMTILTIVSRVTGFIRTWAMAARSEERRVGKERRSRWSPYH